MSWLLFIWAVNTGRVLEASLGYFINPLLSVWLGVLVRGERMLRGQWLAVGIAAAGVVWLAVDLGTLPWVSLVLAASFGAYGLIRKTVPVGSIEGLSLEVGIMAPLAVA